MKKTPGRRGLVARWLLFTMLLTTQSALSVELVTVLKNATVTPPNRVDFREERHNPMLKEPLVLTGHLEYLQVGVLRKVIKTPFEESFLIEFDRVVIERDGEVRELTLNKIKSLRALLGAIEAILSGETAKLVSVFNYELSGSADAWSVQLTPNSRKMGKYLAGLQVSGDDRSVTKIRIDLKDGEWHLMDILRNDPAP